jgi:MFS family permease
LGRARRRRSFPSALSLITNIFTERGERARAIGLWGADAGVAIALGPIVGGWLLEHFTWVSIFIAMAPVAAVAAAAVALAVPTSRNLDAADSDIPGLVLSSAVMALLVFTIIEAPDYGWGAPRSLAGFALSAALLAAFIVRERRAAHPMLDVRIFRNLRFSAASGAVTCSCAVSPSALSSPAASRPWAPSSQPCSCPLTPGSPRLISRSSPGSALV